MYKTGTKNEVQRLRATSFAIVMLIDPKTIRGAINILLVQQKLF